VIGVLGGSPYNKLSMPKEVLSIHISDWLTITRHIRSTYPFEACGLLGGHADIVNEVIPVDNVARAADRFRMNPAQQVNGLFQLEDHGLELLAIYHSHPNGIAVPSETDIREWRYESTLSLILSRRGSEWIGRAYRFVGSSFELVSLNVISGRSDRVKSKAELIKERKRR